MQTTIASSIHFLGVGLHSGSSVRMVLEPAPENFGIWFKRLDVDKHQMIPARYDAVCDTTLCTKIKNESGVSVSTVEHIMAALSGTAVNNVLISLDGPEVPIMDGSAIAFVNKIMQTGLHKQSKPLRAIRVLRDIQVDSNQAYASLTPSDALSIDFEIDFPDQIIGYQQKYLQMTNGCFVRELSDCRTFISYEQVEELHQAGLGLGGSLENTVVVNKDKVLNPEGFRRHDECVRHKMLDAVGDLYLAGAPILGTYRAKRAGHGITNRLLHALFNQRDSWEFIICDPHINHRLLGTYIKPTDLVA